MKKLHSKLTVGEEHQGLDLYASIKLDGKEQQRFKCDSFVGNFTYILNALMHGGLRNVPHIEAGDGSPATFGSARGLTGATNTSPIQVSQDDSNYFFNTKTDDYVYIWGVEGNTAANGFFKVVKVDNNTVELYDMDGNPVAGNGAYTSGGKILNMGFRQDYIRSNNFDGTFRWGYNLANWQVIVGKDTTPVDVTDKYLHDRIPAGSGDNLLQHGARSISAVVTDKPTSRFTISKSFTNGGSVDVSVNEIGVVTQGNDSTQTTFDNVEYNGLLLVRDVLGSTLTIPGGSTLTVDYELIIRLSPDTQDTETDGTNGGFMDDFMNALRGLAVGNDNYNEALFNMLHRGIWVAMPPMEATMPTTTGSVWVPTIPTPL